MVYLTTTLVDVYGKLVGKYKIVTWILWVWFIGEPLPSLSLSDLPPGLRRNSKSVKKRQM